MVAIQDETEVQDATKMRVVTAVEAKVDVDQTAQLAPAPEGEVSMTFGTVACASELWLTTAVSQSLSMYHPS